ncbi:hypothetical protein QTI24_19300 [Variovorax sp. J22P240]|uniref:hypothetical protein n=1 Tax=Variovorax sp. J22P240 TaxID=3053514 RepID=UPI002577A0C4|nr:hypothetical protein [Variovorax sp. J22P240]MDM0000769.1 hypothetical protein [Variovorax sp. J22P240]
MFIAVLAVASSVGPAFAAGLKALSPVDAMQKFARCDASFFALLAADPTPFGSAIELTRKGPHATPKVRNPWAGVRQDGVQEFAQPIEVDGLRLLAWREDAASVPPLGTFIRWGFEVEGKPERVAVRLNRLLPLHLKLSSRDGTWTRGEARNNRDPANEWKLPAMPLGVLPKRPNTVDRVLAAERSEEPGRTRLYCTLQGDITLDLLRSLRPLLPEMRQQGSPR